jgi:5-methylcytosine-specific restriction protein B
MTLLLVRAGGDCEDAPGNLAEHRVSVAFSEPDASACATYEDAQRLVQQTHPNESVATIARWAGSLWNFRNPEHDHAHVVMPVDLHGKRGFAIGRVEGPYQFTPGVRDRHRRQVTWLRTDIPASACAWDLQNRLGLPQTCYRLATNNAESRLMALAHGAPLAGSPEEDLAQGHPDPTRPQENPVSPFTASAFTLLAQLHANPTEDTYTAIKPTVKAQLAQPLESLVATVVNDLPEATKAAMETEEKLLSRFTKNDYGRGGIWPYIWAAIYTKGTSRLTGAQLFLFIDHEEVRCGFSIGENAGGIRQRFRSNAAKYRVELLNLLTPIYEGTALAFGEDADGRPRSVGLSEWIGKTDGLGPRACVTVSKDRAVSMDLAQWKALTLRWWNCLYPLVLLANLDEPMPAVRSYLQQGHSEGWLDALDGDSATDAAPVVATFTHAIVTLDQLSMATGLTSSTLGAWIAATRRKGQAILAGPPGTGKTFCARWLAAHLVGGGDGIVDIVQFHPAYTYEDFIEGIRPQAKDGGLEYPVLPGRFLRFLTAASQRTGTSVLIIDEINRANLAQVFGELMYLLEYRQGAVGPEAAPPALKLANGSEVVIPPRIVLLGTMNTADRSIALVDHALRRRFAILSLQPEYRILVDRCTTAGREAIGVALRQILEEVNRAIDDRHYHLGISYFLDVARVDAPLELLASVWTMEIEPYLDEYFADQVETARRFSWSQIAGRFTA